MTLKAEFYEQYDKMTKIGHGSYGVVFKARRKTTQDIVALKKVRINRNCDLAGRGKQAASLAADQGIPSTSLREIAALKSLKHPNIVELQEVKYADNSLFLIFECCEQDLKQALAATESGFSEKETKSYLWQLLKAIAFCHSRRILHRDLKLQNLLLTQDGTIKLADFGLARFMSLPLKVVTKEVVTLWYRAPELILGANMYGPPVDIWSLACIFYELRTKKVLFQGDSEIDQLFNIFHTLGTPNESHWSNITTLPYYKTNFPQWPKQDLTKLMGGNRLANDLLCKMLIYDPFQRISAQDSMKHEFFNSMLEDNTSTINNTLPTHNSTLAASKRPSLRNIQDPSSSSLSTLSSWNTMIKRQRQFAANDVGNYDEND